MSDDIRRRIETRINQGEFLANLLHVAHKQSAEVQSQFAERLAAIARTVREILGDNSLIKKIPYEPGRYWPSVRGQRFAFIDGGVAKIDLPSAAPIGIRVGSYLIRPGDKTDAREKFNIELSLVDDLYSDEGVLYDNDFEDLAKLRDAARIVSEVAVAHRLAHEADESELDIIVMHGPLVNPVSPYGLADFPSFGLQACRKLLGDENWNGTDDQRQFVPFYLQILNEMRATGKMVVGAVERSIGKEPVVLNRILDSLRDKKSLRERDEQLIRSEVRAYGLNDSSLFDVVLDEGEYLAPMPINRQGPENKWPDDWREEIRSYPAPLTTYLKPSSLVLPFRLEAFDGCQAMEAAVSLMLHTSRLLPSYGFPVGLDIVDKFAKVPSWLTRSVKGQYQVVLLKKAIESGDPATIAFAKRVLAARGRDWLFRPEA